MSTRVWYRFQNAADDPTVVDIHVNDFIGDWIDDYWGFGVTAKQFLEQLAGLDARVSTIRVHLNSPGGDVFAAHTIANALRDQRLSKGRTVETIVDGLAASAATIIMMAGSPVRVADNGVVMIHNPWSVGVGNAADMRKMADDLDTVRNTIVAAYQWHSALSAEALIALMDAETWMSADEAITNGFADEKIDGLKVAAGLDPRALERLTVPEKFQGRVAAFLRPAPAPASGGDPAPTAAAASVVLRACREGECLDLAEDLVAGGATVEQVHAAIATERTRRAQAQQRQHVIEAACTAARQPELAAGYIRSGLSVEDIRAQLTIITAKLDRVEIDTGLAPDTTTNNRRAIDYRAVYARLNQPRA